MLCTRLADQVLDPIAHLRAFAVPVIHPAEINPQTFFLTTRQGIEESNAFNLAAISGFAAVGDNDVVERALLGSAPG